MMIVSSHFGAKPETRPIRMPPLAATVTTTTPTKNENRAPTIRRESMSRPSGSVPSGKAQSPPACHAGGRSVLSRNCSVGSWGAIQGAKIAVNNTLNWPFPGKTVFSFLWINHKKKQPLEIY